jgi:hypothetical protein
LRGVPEDVVEEIGEGRKGGDKTFTPKPNSTNLACWTLVLVPLPSRQKVGNLDPFPVVGALVGGVVAGVVVAVHVGGDVIVP